MVDLPKKEVVILENFLLAIQCFEKSDKLSIVGTLDVSGAKKLMESICDKNGSIIEHGFSRISASGTGCVGRFFESLHTSYGDISKNIGKCLKCGHDNEEGSKFCNMCGNKLDN